MSEIGLEERPDSLERLNAALERSAPSGWKVSVQVWALEGDPVEWHLVSRLKDPETGNLVFNKTKDKMPKRDHYLVEFDLKDHSGLGLRFEPNPMKAFWVQTGSDASCPAEACYSDEIYAISVDPRGSTMTVRNEDHTVQKFMFSLNFVDSSGVPRRFDPGGENEDGGLANF